MAMNYSFQGVYKELLTGYVEEKYALGLKFTAQVRRLKQFDQLSFSFSCLTVDNLSRDIVDAFVYEPGITENTSRIRSCNIRNFAEYMLAHGKDAYVFPPRQFRAPPPYLPYIFTKEQIIRLFTELDSKASQFSRIRSRMDSAVIIRMLYGCGLRISEALNLRIQDVDLEQGILFIRSSKFDKDRTVPMSANVMPSHFWVDGLLRRFSFLQMASANIHLKPSMADFEMLCLMQAFLTGERAWDPGCTICVTLLPSTLYNRW